MILKIETEINGNFKIENNFEVKYHPYKICIKSNDKEKKYLISIAKRIYNYSSGYTVSGKEQKRPRYQFKRPLIGDISCSRHFPVFR